MKNYILTLRLQDGNVVAARVHAATVEEEVHVQWSGATDRVGPIVMGKHSVGFLRWYLQARAQHLQGQFEFRVEENGSD